ncbi:MAG: cache domain-containing protein [Janthinobacterium lividum]
MHWPTRRRFPLHVHISAMLTLMLLLIGTLLGLFNYRQASQIILGSSQQLFARLDQDVRLDLQNTYQPIRNVLNLLALADPGTHAPLEQRLKLLAPFNQALTDNPNLTSLFIGDIDGSFFMVRPLRTDALKTLLKAPSGAQLQVWSVERDAQGMAHSQSLFYDNQLQLIARQQNSNEPYDPRKRPWFMDANNHDGAITTAPYVFYSGHQVGTTLARRSSAGTVIAADLTLAQLSATLSKHKITPSTQAVLYDPQGNAVAYPDSSQLVVEGGTPHLARVADLSPVLAKLLAQGVPADQRLTVTGRTWIIAHSLQPEGGPGGLQLALLMPEDELLADAYRLRRNGALLTLTALLLCLPFGWLAARLMVRPMRALVKEAESVRRFEFERCLSQPSAVLEVDELTTAMQRMKGTLGEFFSVASRLCAEPQFAPLLQHLLEETLMVSQAHGGLIYQIDESGPRLSVSGVIIQQQRLAPSTLNLRSRLATDLDAPDWMRQACSGSTALVTSLGFENAQDLQVLMSRLQSPRVHLVAIPLRNRGQQLVGLLVLLHRDTGMLTETDTLGPDRIAFIRAVISTAAAGIVGHEPQPLAASEGKLEV